MQTKRIIIAALFVPALAIAQNKGTGADELHIKRDVASIDSFSVRQLYFEALRKKTTEDLKGAGELFDRVLQIDPRSDAAMYQLSNIKSLQKQPDEARSLLEQAVALKPDNEWYWIALADSYSKTNDLPKLEYVFNELLRINPGKPDYYFDKASAQYLQRKYNAALETYSRLEQLTGITDDLIAVRQKVYLKLDKAEQAAAELEQMLANNPGNVKYYLLLGELYTANKQNNKALSILQRAEKVVPGNGMLHLALADAYRTAKKYNQSFTHLEKAFAATDLDVDQKIRIVMGYVPKFPDSNARASALELSSIAAKVHTTDAKAQAIYGDMLLQNSKYAEAKAAYRNSLQINSDIYIVHEELVRLELNDNEIDLAIKDGENALTLFPNQAWMNYLVGVAWLQKKNAGKALGYLKNTVSLEMQDNELSAQSYASLGDCYHELHENSKSDSAYDKSLTYNADNIYTLNNYAYYLSIRGEELDKAARMSKHSNDLQPNTASFEDTYAWILFKQKKYAEAKLWIEKALQHTKGTSATQTEHYGDIMFYLGNTDAALQNWKKAKQYGSQSPVLDRKINEKKYIE